MNPKFLIAFLIFTTLISVVARLFPHPPNFAPIAALALFAGAYASRTSKWYLLLPLGVMFVSDLFVGFYEPRTMAVVYASFFAIGLIGLLVQKSKSASPLRRIEASWRIGALTLATLTGSILFYLTTNFAVWAFSGMYAPTLGGLFLSYYMAIPFFKFTLLGDLFYVSLFFGSYALAQSPAFRSALTPATKAFVSLKK